MTYTRIDVQHILQYFSAQDFVRIDRQKLQSLQEPDGARSFMAVADGTEDLFWDWVHLYYKPIHDSYGGCHVAHLNRLENGFKNLLSSDHVSRIELQLKVMEKRVWRVGKG